MSATTTTDPRPGWQRRLEERAASLAGTGIDLNRTVAEIVGPLNDWVVDAGPTHLLLNPMSLRWLHFDKVHQTWDDTGFDAGDVAFFVDDGLLDARELTEHERGAWTLPLKHWKTTVEQTAGHLSEADAAARLDELRWQDPEGVWWSLSPDDASWLRWDGDAWVAADPPSSARA